MPQIENNANVLLFDGTSRTERNLTALSPEFALVDGREMVDLLVFIFRFSRQINFIRPDHLINPSTPREDWQSFFENSAPIQLALISKFDFNATEARLQHQLALVEDSLSTKDLFKILDSVLALVVQIDQWYTSLNPQLTFRTEIGNIIRSNLQASLQEWITVAQAAQRLGYGLKIPSLDPIWAIDSTDPAGFIAYRGNVESQILAMNENLREIFQLFNRALIQIVSSAPSFLDQAFEFTSAHQPHLALLYTFLRLFIRTQADLNQFTSRHLDFFYREVLLLKEKEAIPDEVHLVFELAKQITSSYLVEANTLFTGGKDRNGAEILFALDKNLVVDKANIKNIHTLFFERGRKDASEELANEEDHILSIKAAEVANSADGLGEVIENVDPPSWKTLGGKCLRGGELPDAKLGFAIASPVLDLREGEREISIRLTFTKAVEVDLSNMFSAFVTTEDELLAINPPQIVTSREKEVVNISLRLPSTAPSIVSYNEEVHQKGLNVKVPIIYLELKTIKQESHPYTVLNEIDLEKVAISVHANKIYSLVLSNANGQIDPTKPFMPFGSVPVVGSTFFLGSAEAFQKRLTEFAVKVEWDGLQTGIEQSKATFINFGEYYEGYYDPEDDDAKKRYVEFQAIVEGLKDGAWRQLDLQGGNPNLLFNFISPNEGQVENSSRTFAAIKGRDNSIGKQIGKIDSPSLEIYQPGTQNGFLRFVLSPNDFKHGEYPEVLTRQTLALGKFPDEIVAEAVYRKNGGLKVISKTAIDKAVVTFSEVLRGMDEINGMAELVGLRTILNCLTQISSGVNNSDRLTMLEDEIRGLDDIIPKEPQDNSDLKNRLRVILNDPNQEIEQKISNILTILKEFKDILTNHIDQIFDPEKHFQSIKEKIEISRNNINEIIKRLVELENLMEEAKSLFPPVGSKTETEVIIPNPPFTPTIKEIYISYKAEASSTEQGELNFFHIHPFEKTFEETLAVDKRLDPDLESPIDERIPPFPLLPQFRSGLAEEGKKADLIEGALFIGLEGLAVPNTLPLLFQFAEGTANPDIGLGTIRWAYLNNNTWVEEVDNELEILRRPDPTSGLIKSGIVELSIPEAANLEHTILRSGMRWLRVAMTDQVVAVSETIAIRTQAAKATFLDRGRIRLGIRDIQPEEEVTINLQLVNPEVINPELPLIDKWFYLRQNQWIELDTDRFIDEDTTNELRQSGTFRLKLPADISDSNTLLASGFFWFKIDIFQQAGVIEVQVSANTPSVSVQFSGKRSDFGRLEMPFPSESIGKTLKNDANLKSVAQPFPSFDGRIAEKPANFYIRASEHVRHKGRGVSIFDYERLVLEQFPEIFRVKCIRHNLPDVGVENESINDYSLAPGFVTLAIIPVLVNRTFADPLKPKADLGLLNDIEAFIKDRISPFVTVCVLNPIYEAIQVTCDVEFRQGFSEVFFKAELEKSLRQFLAPWAFDEGADIVFGGEIFASSIVQFIEKQSYVDFVKELSIQKVVESDDPCQLEMLEPLAVIASEANTLIRASNVRSILTSSRKHVIKII